MNDTLSHISKDDIDSDFKEINNSSKSYFNIALSEYDTRSRCNLEEDIYTQKESDILFKEIEFEKKERESIHSLLRGKYSENILKGN